MKVVLSEELFERDALEFYSLPLLSLFYFGCEQRHAILLGFERNQSECFRVWFESRPRYEQDAIEIALEYGLQSESREIIENVIQVEPVATAIWEATQPRIPPDEAMRLLGQPLEVLLEDGENDSAFLRAVATGLHGAVFSRYLDKRWLQFGHGGGLPSIRRRLGELRDMPGASRRLWVIFDSDALVPGRPSREALAVERVCEEGKIQKHRLLRRAMENYIPPHALDEYSRGTKGSHDLRRAASAFLSMTSQQRHHYGMRNGFDGDRSRPNKGDTASREEISILFDNLATDARQFLRAGFGNNVGDLFKPDPANGWHGISEERLRRDDEEREMEGLFQKLLRWV